MSPTFLLWLSPTLHQIAAVYLRGSGQLYTTRPEEPCLRKDEWDRISEVSFNFLHTLKVLRTCISVIIWRIQDCNQDSYGNENLISSWGWGNTIFEITLRTWVFQSMVPKVSFFFAHLVGFWKLIIFFWKFKKPELPFKIES